MPRQVRIFVPNNPPYDAQSWAETTIARIIKPTESNFGVGEWFWFSRYINDRSDSGDCEIAKIPQNFDSSNGTLKSIRFRFAVTPERATDFETRLAHLIADEGCAYSDIRDYDDVSDLGWPRFLGGPKDLKHARERADLVVRFLFSLSRLILHSIQGPDESGRFVSESNTNSKENPMHSSFESIHHLFCNMTSVPLRALVSVGPIGTDWNMPNHGQIITVPIRF